MSHPLQATMSEITATLKAAVATTASFGHNLTAGQAREAKLIDALKPFLPERYGVATGTATNLSGDRSRQQDGMIFDRVAGAPFVRVREDVVLPIELVTASLQVKTQLPPGGAPAVVENLASCKRLLGAAPRQVLTVTDQGVRRDQVNSRPFCAAVALDGSEQSFFALVEASRDVMPEHRVDAVAVIGKGVGVWATDGADDELAVEPERATHIKWIPAGDDALLVLYLILINGIARHVLPPYSPGAYLSAAGVLDHGAWTASLKEHGFPPVGNRAARRRQQRTRAQ